MMKKAGRNQAAIYNGLVPIFCEASVVVCMHSKLSLDHCSLNVENKPGTTTSAHQNVRERENKLARQEMNA